VATVELLGGASNAVAEAFRAVSQTLTPEAVAATGFRASVFNGLRDGNVRFFEELSRTSQRVFDGLRGPRGAGETGGVPDPESVARNIDYERLARLVAAEMKKKPSSTAG
jgi:hypothetical protein